MAGVVLMAGAVYVRSERGYTMEMQGPPMGSDWVRSSVLEGRPFHADSDELHPHPSRPRHSRGRPTTE